MLRDASRLRNLLGPFISNDGNCLLQPPIQFPTDQITRTACRNLVDDAIVTRLLMAGPRAGSTANT